MKKLLSILLVAIMIVSCMTMVAFASEDDGTYTVTFSVKNNPGFMSYGAKINYDSTALKLVSIKKGLSTDGSTFSGNIKNGKIGFADSADITDDGILFTAVFELTENAEPGKTYNVTVTMMDMVNAEYKDITLDVVVSGGSITVPAAECKHEHAKIINEKAATCTEDGYTGDTYCEDCKTTIEYGKAIDKLGHKNTEIRNAKEATCGEAGYTGDTWCKDCETKISEGTVIPATGDHTWDEGKVTKDSTCTEKGEMTYTCEVCGGTKTEPIPATDHKYTGKVTKEPTCTENGEMTYTCEACGDSYTEEIDTDGHHYQDGKCVDCGEKDPNYSEKDNSDLDDVPKTGDITPMLTGAAVVLVLLGGTAVLVTKRKFSR